MKNPKLIVKPFAKNGQKNVIPENYETSMESNQATWDQGFGQITMLPVAAGGLPPKGQDFNGIFNQISENIVYLSQGGRFKFSAEYAEAIGGYPKGAILQSDDEKKEYLSLIDNNKVDFNTAPDISASWKLVNTDDLLAQIASKQPKGDYATKTELNSGLAGKQPIGDYATRTEVGLKLDKNAVVQSTGTSTTSVMSQDASTKAFQVVGYSYSKTESNNNFQPKGSYQPTGNYLNKDSKDVQVVSGEIQSKERVGTIFGDSNLCFLGSYNGKAAIGTYDGVNFRYAVHPNKTGTMALTSDLFGIEQQWYDLKNERSVGVNYQNNTAKPICLFVRLGSSQFQTTEIKVSGKTVAMWTSLGTTASTTSQGAFTVIPPGASYAVIANQGSSNVLDWTEFR